MELIKKNAYVMDIPFKIVYFIFAFFTYCNLTFMKPIMSYAVVAVLGFGVLAGVPRLFKWKGYIKTPGFVFAILFLVSFVLSAVLNIKYGYADNFKGLVWMGFHFCLLFACDVDRSEQDYKKEFHVIAVFFMLVMLIMSTASLVQFVSNYSFEEYLPDLTRLAGLVWGRLWGVFTDPNYASAFAVISILLSFYFFEKVHKVALRVIIGLNAFIQIAYIAFSDSRTGLVTLFITVFVYIYLVCLRKVKKEKLAKYTICIALALAVAISSLIVTSVVEKIGGEIVVSHYENMDDPTVEVPDLDDGREQDIKNDPSNRRFDIWKSGIEIFCKSPVTGVSYFNIKQFALDVVPKTYLVNNDHGQFNNMHNMLFNLLVGQGVIGALLFTVFAIYAVVYVLKRLFKVENEDYSYIVVMIVCAIAGFVASMFLTDIIYVNSPNSMIFWLFLGYIMHYLKKNDLKKKA